jgi:hypothetical protein
MSKILFKPLGHARIIGGLMLLTAMLLVSGCSSVRLAYNNGADLAYWWLDSYLDFSDSQANQVRQDLRTLLAWHRSQQLPQTAALLNRMQTALAQPVTAEQACTLTEEIRQHLNPTLAQAEPYALALVQSLRDKQISHLRARLDKSNAEYRTQWSDSEQQAARRLKSMTDRYEYLYGSLEPAQRDSLARASRVTTYDFSKSLAERIHRQQDLLLTLTKLQETRDPDNALPILRALLHRQTNQVHALDSSYVKALSAQSCATFAAVHSAASAQQRERAVQRLGDYANDARELSLPPMR